MSRFLNRRLSKIEDTMYGARKSMEDLTDAELGRAMAVLLAPAYGEEASRDDLAFYASLRPILAGSRRKHAHLSDDELNVQIGRLIGKSIATPPPD